jgi:hypothetical protein
MNIKLFYKSDLINEIIFDNSEYQDFLLKNGGMPGLGSLILFIEYLIDLDINNYVFGKEFILNAPDTDIIINLKEADYKRINREDKIKNILN